MRQQIGSAIHGVVQVSRLADGTRKVITISEIVGMEGDMITMQDIFVFERHGIDESGKVRGQFRASGIQPQFAERLATAGCRLRSALFVSDPLHRRLRRLRFLHRRSDCFRVERTPFPGGTFTHSRPAPFHGARVTEGMLSQPTVLARDGVVRVTSSTRQSNSPPG